MGMPQLIVTAVLVEVRSKSEVAHRYGVSRRWVVTLVARYLAEGDTGLQPRSRRPLTSPHRTSAAVEDEIVAIRKGLDRGGCGDDRVSSRAASRPQPGGLDDLADLERTRVVIPQPRKRPRSSYLSFAAEQPNPDAAGCTHEFLTWLVGQRLSYSVGFTLPDSFAAALQTMPSVS